MPNDQKPIKTDDSKSPTTDVPPILIQEDVLPPMPQQSNQTTTVTSEEPKVDILDSGSGAPENDIKIDTVMPAVVTNGPKKKFAGGKVIATILGLFLLVGGIGAGVFLTGQNQNINEQAGTACNTIDNQSECNSTCSPVKGTSQKSYECKWYSASSSCGESGVECGGGGGGGPTEEITAGNCSASQTQGAGWFQCGSGTGAANCTFCLKAVNRTCNDVLAERQCASGIGGCGAITGAVETYYCQGNPPPNTSLGCQDKDPLPAGVGWNDAGKNIVGSFCGTVQVDDADNTDGNGRPIFCSRTDTSACNTDVPTTPPTTPPVLQCITKPFVSGTVTAKADGKTTVKCTFSEKVDCIAPTVNGQGSPCTFTGWEGNTGVYDCNITYASVTSVSCNTFPGSVSNCCASGNAVPKPTVTITPTPAPITAVCQNIKAYSSTWTELTAAQLAALKTGNTVNFCVTGSATGGSFNKAKLTINNIAQAETTMKRPGSIDFCQTYTIPANTTSFVITAQINHVTLGWK